jgi:hypothetical protein
MATLCRWESGKTLPQGAALAVMHGFATALGRRPVTVKAILREAAEIGGLTWLLIHLLERAVYAQSPLQTKGRQPTAPPSRANLDKR